MASLERTAYPRFPRTVTLRDLQTSFTPRPEEDDCVAEYGAQEIPFIQPCLIGGLCRDVGSKPACQTLPLR